MRIERFPDPATMARAVAARLTRRLGEIQQQGRTPSVVLTGGTVADLIHREVGLSGASSGPDWGNVEFWWGDERYVPAGHADRNDGQVRAAMLSRLPVAPDRVHPMPSDDGTPVTEAAARYEAKIRRHVVAPFDIVMLGMGPDGHVASLFPGSPHLDATGVVGVTDSPKPPPARISLTFELLNHAREIWLLVTGEGKSPAVARALAGAPVEEIPAAGLQGPVTWFLDDDASRSLPVPG